MAMGKLHNEEANCASSPLYQNAFPGLDGSPIEQSLPRRQSADAHRRILAINGDVTL